MNEMLNLPGIARFYGVKPDTARAMIARGEIPATPHGKRGWRALLSTLEQHEHDKAVKGMLERRAQFVKTTTPRRRGRTAKPLPNLAGCGA